MALQEFVAEVSRWFTPSNVSLLAALGSLGAAAGACLTAYLTRQQHLDAMAGAPTVEFRDHHPRVQWSFDNADAWDAMGDHRLTIRNVGGGAMLDASVRCRVLSPSGKPVGRLATAELFRSGDDAFAVRADGRAISRLRGGVADAHLEMRVEDTGELFDLSPGGEATYRMSNAVQTRCLAEALASDDTRITGHASSVLELTITYTSAGKKTRKRIFDVEVVPVDLGGSPPDAPRVVGVNFQRRLVRTR